MSLSYTDSLIKGFDWAKNAYQFSIGLSSDIKVPTDAQALAKPIAPKIKTSNSGIWTALDWNNSTVNQLSNLAAIYHVTDQLQSYHVSVRTTLNTRINENKKRIDDLQRKLKSVKTVAKGTSLTSVTIRGGNPDMIETDPKFYTQFGRMAQDPGEDIFRLADTGIFSSIRTKGGSLATIVLERSTLPIMEEVGSLADISDGSKTTYWAGFTYSPAPVRVSNKEIPWLNEDYQDGQAAMFTYLLEKPVIFGEVFIDPLASEHQDLVSVHWTPYEFMNAYADAYFASGAVDWTFSTDTGLVTGLGSGGGNAIQTRGYQVSQSNYSMGKASYLFALAAAYNRTASASFAQTGSGYLVDQRVQVDFRMKGPGCKAGCRIVWLDNNGYEIGFSLREIYSEGFYKLYSMSEYAPAAAVSGRIELGIFSPTENSYVYFDYINLFVGEKVWDANRTINKTTTLQLPNRSVSNRVSFVVVQRNPRRKMLAIDNLKSPQLDLGNKEIAGSLQEKVFDLVQKASSQGTKRQVFSYGLGFRELDVRYREFIPRGAVFSKPIVCPREIRKVWLTAELEGDSLNSLNFVIYPYADDLSKLIQAAPFIVGSQLDGRATTYSEDGDVFDIFTNEEWEAGFTNSPTVSNRVLVDPVKRFDSFEGTTREGKVALKAPLHIRRVKLQTIQEFLKTNGVYSFQFDPNASVVYGITADSTWLDYLRQNSISQGASALSPPASLVVTTAGYIPIKVTVRSDRYTAYPDLYGKPVGSLVNTASGELLIPAQQTTTDVTTKYQNIGFDEWLSTTKVAKFNELWKARYGDTTGPNQLFPSYPGIESVTLKQVVENNAGSIGGLRASLKQWYDYLASNNQLDKAQNRVVTTALTTSKDMVYKTEYQPIVSGRSGTFLTLYYISNNTKVFIDRDKYTVVPEIGLITLTGVTLSNIPSGAVLYADYTYFNNPKNQLKFNADVSSMLPGFDGIITRNMTDYETGSVPVLRAFDPDPASSTYYPVIEYYVSPNSELVFSREFFKYGDVPAIIEVEYESLNLTPRFAVYAVRDTSPTKTPMVKSMSFGYRSAGASLERTNG